MGGGNRFQGGCQTWSSSTSSAVSTSSRRLTCPHDTLLSAFGTRKTYGTRCMYDQLRQVRKLKTMRSTARAHTADTEPNSCSWGRDGRMCCWSVGTGGGGDGNREWDLADDNLELLLELLLCRQPLVLQPNLPRPTPLSPPFRTPLPHIHPAHSSVSPRPLPHPRAVHSERGEGARNGGIIGRRGRGGEWGRREGGPGRRLP